MRKLLSNCSILLLVFTLSQVSWSAPTATDSGIAKSDTQDITKLKIVGDAAAALYQSMTSTAEVFTCPDSPILDATILRTRDVICAKAQYKGQEDSNYTCTLSLQRGLVKPISKREDPDSFCPGGVGSGIGVSN